ncbi:unnamed protein product [Rhizophagus irregularis]|uniref:Endonuclease/exonuclease/phosphatase domain-containing protein n=1 Tax=Rhizophagus irregularis TaxID=588596 RepID=A0A916E9H8_9GLOM|nr:unnamed protein product [Rhizophagus irregularis]
MMNNTNNNTQTHSFNNNSNSPLHNRKNNSSFNKLPDVLKIATINIKHLTTIKKEDIIDLIKFKNIQILGVSETWLSHKQSTFQFLSDRQQYTTFFNNEHYNQKGKGVGLIVKKNIAQYIYRNGSYNGRIIFIDFMFKHNKKLRIIQYYGVVNAKASTEKKEESKKTINELFKLMREALSTQHELIVMGDFNQKYEKYSENKTKSTRNKYWNNIFYDLEEKFNLYDPHRIMYDITPSNPIYTWTNGVNYSRIDYIWITENLMMNYEDTMFTDISQDFRTDHKMLSFSLWTEELCSTHLVFNHKQKKIKKIIYKYDEMNNEKWEEYQNIQKDYLSNTINEQFNFDDIEKHWDVIKKGIYKSNEIIKKEKKKINIKNRNPNQQTESYQGRQFLINLRRQIKKKHGRKYLKGHWNTIGGQLNKYSSNKIEFI